MTNPARPHILGFQSEGWVGERRRGGAVELFKNTLPLEYRRLLKQIVIFEIVAPEAACRQARRAWPGQSKRGRSGAELDLLGSNSWQAFWL